MALIPEENSQTSLGQTKTAPINWYKTSLEIIDLPLIIISSSVEETKALGKNIAGMLDKGSIVAISGQLGAGKTCLTKGIAEGIGVKEEITSATYTIISEYEAILPFYHIDAYRLKGNDDFSAIGGEEIIYGEGISVIEWSDRIAAFIPISAIKIDIDIIEEGKRRISLYMEGKK